MPIINPKTDGNEHLLGEAYPEDELESSAVRFCKVDGNEYRLEAVDPYALWCIKPKKGSLPKELEGTWTSPSDAEAAIKAHLIAVKFKESLKNGTTADTQSKSISDKSGSKSS